MKPSLLSEREILRYSEARIPKLHRTSAELRGPCPIHEGKRDSLAINPDTGQWYCHSGCSRGGSIFDFEAALTGGNGSNARAAVFELAGRAPERRIVKTYGYTEESGKLLYQCVRYGPKDFKQRRPDGRGGWIWNLKGVRHVLYPLAAVIAAPVVVIAEGEKDADAATAPGFVATCNPIYLKDWYQYFGTAVRLLGSRRGQCLYFGTAVRYWVPGKEEETAYENSRSALKAERLFSI